MSAPLVLKYFNLRARNWSIIVTAAVGKVELVTDYSAGTSLARG